MIDSPILYLLVVILLGGGLWWVEIHSRFKIFSWLPAIVLIYLVGIALSQSGLFAANAPLEHAYREMKSWLLPAMLFLMMLKLDIRSFTGLGKNLIISYSGAVLSLAFAFIAVFYLFGFNADAAGVFGALSGSWTGGTGNMLAVAGALNIPDTQLGPALIVDSLLYTLWVVTLLLAVPFASRFDRWSGAGALRTVEPSALPDTRPIVNGLGFTLLTAIMAAALSRYLSSHLPLLPPATWLVILATLFGLAASFTPLGHSRKSGAAATFFLYVLIALIGTHAHLDTLTEVPRYLLAAAAILALHAGIMLLLAKAFHLNLFSIGVASLANIGGVASAPILAAAYHRTLVPVAVVMAVMGYLIGTVAGLAIAGILKTIAS